MSEFRLISAESSTEVFPDASIILHNKGKILPTEFDKVGRPMRRRLPPSEILARNLKEAGGITVPELVRRAQAKDYPVSNNAVNYILRDQTQNPGLFTIEAIAAGIDKAPEQLAAEFLGVRTDDPVFTGSQFAMLNEIFKGMTPAQKQKAAPHIAGLLVLLQHIKSQK